MSERRQYPRYPTVWVYYVPKTGGQADPCRVVNVSEDGVFLAMAERPDLGSTLMIEIVAEGCTVLVVGTVARHCLAPPGAPMPSGVGLKLTTKPKNWSALVAGLHRDDDRQAEVMPQNLDIIPDERI